MCTIRLQAIMKVAYVLQKSQNLSLTAIGMKINGDIDVKHKIKTVDRLENNRHLHYELSYIYSVLSSYLFKYLSKDENMAVIIDLCFLQDRNNVQILSAEIASKGHSLQMYRERFNAVKLKVRAKQFLSKLSECIPSDKKILVIMDAVFGKDRFKEIESYNRTE